MNFTLHIVWLGIAAATVGLLERHAAAQAPKAFEVASVRPNEPGTPSRPTSVVRGNRFDVVSFTPGNMIMRAFGIETLTRIIGPDWIKREPFTIRAVMPDGAGERDVPELLKTLLIERFGMQWRVEPRPFPVYELVLDPRGHKFAEAAPSDDLRKEFAKGASDRANLVDGPGGKIDLSDRTDGLPGDERRTVLRMDPDGARTITVTPRTFFTVKSLPPNGVRQLDAERITMADLSQLVGQALDRPVMDKTGLMGIYRLKTVLPPVLVRSATFRILLEGRIDTTPSGVSITRSLDELGLKLEAKETPLDFIVVDKIERPSVN